MLRVYLIEILECVVCKEDWGTRADAERAYLVDSWDHPEEYEVCPVCERLLWFPPTKKAQYQRRLFYSRCRWRKRDKRRKNDR